MARRFLSISTVVLFVLGTAAAQAEDPPIYEPGFLEPVAGKECAPEAGNPFDAPNSYGDKCERLRFVFGPIWAKPGQNDVLIQPVTIEKPAYDGYIVRFKPNLIGAQGTPPVEDVHLHHGTWLNLNRDYGDGPWIASGEEKTIAPWPEGYGLKVMHDDLWLFLHMVHNATPLTFPVWATYEIDYVRADLAEEIQPDGEPLLTNTKQIWLDVMSSPGPNWGGDSYLLNPIFNSQRGFGGIQPGACKFPKENCARFNSEGNATKQQGVPATDVPGWDWPSKVGGVQQGTTDEFAGTLVMMGGHVHFGGLADEVSVVRDLDGDGKYEGRVIDEFGAEVGEERPILISDAYYWDHQYPDRIGARPDSWDLSMTGATRDIGWSVNLRQGDVLRLNGVYDTSFASWYEQMGIVMTWVVSGEYFGFDPFAAGMTFDPGIPVGARVPNGPDGLPLATTCVPNATTLCLRGTVSHGHSAAASNHASCPPSGCPDLRVGPVPGPLVDRIDIGGFRYGIADHGAIQVGGIPRVTIDEPVTFTNVDTADYVWHTVTRCKEPCTGSTSASYPVPDGGNGSAADTMDFDSSELGVGAAPAQRVSWTFTPDRLGVYTFFCRIHPSMRGAIEVVAA